MNHVMQRLIITVFICLRCRAQFTLSSVTLPQPMSAHYAAIYNDKFTVFGGDDGVLYGITTSRSTSISYNLNIDTWAVNNVTMPLNIPKLFFYSDMNVNINGKVYIINQATGGARNYQQLFLYDLTTNKYTVAPTIPTHRVQNPCIVYNSKNKIIYTIGGWDAFGGGEEKKYTQRYNTLNNSWITDGADTVIAKYLGGCALDAANDYIYYFGGYVAASSQTLDEIQRYSVSNDQWTVLPATLSSARRTLKCRLLSTDSNIYCIGGDNSGVMSNIVDVFDPSTETITNTINLNVARTFFSAILFNDNKCIIVSGGEDSSGYLDSIETFGDCIAPTQTPSTSPTQNPSTTPTRNPTKNPSNSPTAVMVTEPNEAYIHFVSATIAVLCVQIGIIINSL